MSSNYNEIGRWNVGTPDGNSEEMILEKSKIGDIIAQTMEDTNDVLLILKFL